MNSLTTNNNFSKIEFRILQVDQSDEFDGGYHFISCLTISEENLLVEIKEIELNLRFFKDWLEFIYSTSKKELVSLDGRLRLTINNQHNHLTMKFIYFEIDYEEEIFKELQLYNEEITSFRNKLTKFIDFYMYK
ncbi:hypothetical protein [Bacillus atrophaeus]|uniref:hypothetical protein n=1 Tax=Bacillus atrophaeus TaxID=1452 RepID=UPI000B456171|nr:hypothetical protein [Bacillus atrophaeus]ARW08885.1 hypothetical protein S101359_03907 [Bacillus atrophaeus]